MINIIAWILFGALAGWIASLVMGTNKEQGALANIAVGVLGAFLGGFVVSMVLGEDGITGFNLTSLIVAVGGAIVLLGIVKLLRGSSREV